MSQPICLLHGAALGLVVAGVVALATGSIGWLAFAVWMILTVVLYVGGWIYYITFMIEPPTWDIDFDL
jgi:hypothetical protein